MESKHDIFSGGFFRIFFYSERKWHPNQQAHPAHPDLFIQDVVEAEMEFTKSGALNAASQKLVERYFKAVIEREYPLIYSVA